MRLFQNISIQRKQMLIIMLTTGAALLLVCALFLVFEIVTFRHQMVNDLSTFSGVVGNNVSAALDFDDAKAAAETLSALKAEPNIIGACIYAGDGNLFAEYHRADHSPFRPPSHAGPAGHLFGDDRLQLFRPIISDGESIGTVYLESDMSALHIRLEECALILTGAFALTLFAAFLLSHRLQRWITTPILHLASIAQAVARDKIYSLRAVKEGNDEVAQLIDTFNEMLAQIQARDMNLESQVERRTRELQRENAERKHAEDALRESQALYHSLVEQLPVGIFRKNA
ncbi:MAG TPA: CHASE sensor domain-containing protein, partial [Verrucomicrobiae bacterium]|nr:CHASE sensor domain-containing protein [Verrucomicrobiae bacterium]